MDGISESDFRILMPRCRRDPIFFIRHVLGVEIVTPQQKRLCISVTNNRRTAAPSGHGIGKTFISACLVLWFLYCFPGSKVVTTAPTWFQVSTLLWKEIRNLRQRAAIPLIGKMPPKATELEISTEWFAVGLSTNDPIRFQGIHAPRVMIVLDEATGIPKGIWESAEGIAVGGEDRMLAIGNPTDPSSEFKRVCDSPLWNRVVLSSEDHPNVLTGRNIIPGAVTRGWISERIIDYGGRDTPLFRSRVRGLFPEQGDDMLISLSMVERARLRYAQRVAAGFDPKLTNISCLGVDVARFGSDETVFSPLYIQEGLNPLLGEMSARNGQDTMATVGQIRSMDPPKVGIDDAGLGGGVTDRLNELYTEGMLGKMEIVPVNAAERANDPEKFANRRAEMWWTIREELQFDRLDLPPDNKLEADLTNIKYKYDSRARIILESKDEVKKRLGRSPDRADAAGIALAAYFQPTFQRQRPAQTQTGYRF